MASKMSAQITANALSALTGGTKTAEKNKTAEQMAYASDAVEDALKAMDAPVGANVSTSGSNDRPPAKTPATPSAEEKSTQDKKTPDAPPIEVEDNPPAATPKTGSSKNQNQTKPKRDVPAKKDKADVTTTPTEQFLDIYELFDAPSEWNSYKALPPKKLEEMMASIQHVGQIDNVVVWVQPDGRHMILSGHNRRLAFQEIIKRYGSDKMDDGTYVRDKYRYIRCSVYEYGALSEAQARRIIIDANEARRQSVDKQEKLAVAKQKMELYKGTKDYNGTLIKDLMEDLGLKKSSVYEILSIADMNSILKDMYVEGALSAKQAFALSKLPQAQQALLAKKASQIIPANIAFLKGKYTDQELESLLLLKPQAPETVKVFLRVPREFEAEFRAKAEEILDDFNKRRKKK